MMRTVPSSARLLVGAVWLVLLTDCLRGQPAPGFNDGYVVGEKGTIVHVGIEAYIEAKCRYW